MKRAVAYARFSSDLQREESMEAQTRAIQKYCDANGFVLLTVFADRGISGTSDKRPEFQKMISTATKGDVDAVIVRKLDRFARNRYDSAFYKNILKKNNVKLISVLENLQDSPESVIPESVIEGMNEYYSLNLSREVRKGLQENALECKVTGGPPALGYSVDRNTQKYIINELEQSKEKLLFELTEAEEALKQENFSEEQIGKLFHISEQQLKNGTLANRRLVIDQYINKIIIYSDKIEVYMNLMSDYTVKETIEQ